MKRFLLTILCLAIGGNVFSQNPNWIEDVTAKTGLAKIPASYVYITDINNDDYPDIVIVKANTIKGKIRLFLNVQDSNSSDPKDRYFVDVTEWSNIDIRRNGEHGRVSDHLTFADVDNDGDIDCISCIYYHRWEYYHPDSLDPGDRCEVLLNKGWGQFELKDNNGLTELGLVNTAGTSMLDIDKDGNIDLFIASWFRDYANNVMSHSYLLKGNGDGTFTDITDQTPIKNNIFPLYGANATDWNNDGWMDIATSPYCRSSGSLWKNTGNGNFVDVAAEVGYNTQFLNGDGWGNTQQTIPKALCTWASQPQDYDNDGDIDFFFVLVHGGFGNDVYGDEAGRSTIVLNKGKDNNYALEWAMEKVYRAPPRSSHLGDYDAAWLDLDNDGWIDMAMGNGGYSGDYQRLFILKQDQDHVLQDISRDLEITKKGERISNLYSLQAFDYDLDGDDDLILIHEKYEEDTFAGLTLIENKIGQDNNWIGIKLYAPPNANASAIGARITVYSGGIAQMREIKAGFGHFGGQQAFITNFGLGKNSTIDSIIIRWPTHPLEYTKVTNVPINQFVILDRFQGFWGTLDTEKNQAKQNQEFRIFPNPAKDEILIGLPESLGDEGLIEIIDMQGRVHLTQQYQKSHFNSIRLDIQSLENSYYLIRIRAHDGNTKVLKMCKISP
jgi:hypothetical protein